MFAQWTTNRQKIAPAAANAVTVTPSGTAWANSAWVELTSSVAAASVLTGLMVNNQSISCEFEVDIGTGGVGAEVVICTFRGDSIDNASNTGPYVLPIPIDNIANAARLAVRMRKSGTNTTTWFFAASYYEKPITGNLLTTANQVLVAPSAATGTSVASGSSAWANGSWAQVIASTASAIVIIGFELLTPVGASEWEMDIGIGSAASEVVISTLRWRWNASGGGDGCPLAYMLPIPLDNVAISTRVAVRARCSLAGPQNMATAIMYLPKPL
jgi:hypothetical protein